MDPHTASCTTGAEGRLTYKRFTFFTNRFMRPSVDPLDAPLWWWAMISLRHDDKVLASERISSTSSDRQPAMALSTRMAASVGSWAGQEMGPLHLLPGTGVLLLRRRHRGLH